MYWVALATEDAVMAFVRSAGSTAFLGTGTYPMLNGCYYDLGTWGALTNPCPATTYLSNTARFSCTLHVKKWG
jgi:hypothetical protein